MKQEWIASKCLITSITNANSMEPGKTPSNSMSHQTADYLPLKLCLLSHFDVRSIFKSLRIGTNRIGSEKNVNLISCSTATSTLQYCNVLD